MKEFSNTFFQCLIYCLSSDCALCLDSAEAVIRLVVTALISVAAVVHQKIQKNTDN